MSVFADDSAMRVQSISRLVLAIGERAGDGELPLGLLDELRGEAHKLRGGAAVVGLDTVRRSAAVLESAAAGVVEGVADLDARLVEELERQAGVLAAAMKSLAVPAVGERAAQERAGRTTRTLLSVEDDPTNRTLIEMIVARRSHVRLVDAVDGRGVLGLIRSEDPDLVLLDLNMPGAGGEEILKAVRADEALAALPVLILSADATSSARERLLSAGATAYLTKPVAVAELLAYIDEFCAESGR